MLMQNKKNKQKVLHRFGEYFVQFASVQISVKAPKICPQNLIDKFITKKHQTKEFKDIVKIMLTNDDFKTMYEQNNQKVYLTAVLVLNATPTDNNEYHYDPVEANLQDTQRISMYHTYIDTPLDLKYETFQEAIKNNNYVEKECCINTLYDYYRDGLLNPKKTEVIFNHKGDDFRNLR